MKIFGLGNISEFPSAINSENFSYYFKKIPETYDIIEIYNEEKGTTHAPHDEYYDLNEDILKLGTTCMLNLL